MEEFGRFQQQQIIYVKGDDLDEVREYLEFGAIIEHIEPSAVVDAAYIVLRFNPSDYRMYLANKKHK